MLFKLILSHVIFESKYSMIANRTIQPSCRSLKTGARRNVPLTSSICCCSLKIKDTGLFARFYSTQGYQDGRRTQDSLRRESLTNMDFSDRETLRKRLNAFTGQARKSSSIRRFEPCYRQIYPSKKRKATFKIPKKPPYIPAVYQKKTTSYREKYEKVNLELVKGRRLQWPPLYPSKKRDYPQSKQSADRSHELPPWLLPLYSCKTCHNEDAPSTSEARYSGGAFHRKMEIMESIKHLQTNQPILLGHLYRKAARKDENERLSAVKTANAVEELKRKIDSMQDYLNAMKNMEAYRKNYQTQKMTKETEMAETSNPVRQAYARIYQTKPPTQEREMRVRQSTGFGVAGPKLSDKPLPGTSHADQQLEIAREVLESKSVPKKQHGDSVAQNPEAESNATNKIIGSKYTTPETSNILSVGEIHKESVVMIKQPSWKKQWNHSSQKVNHEPTSNDKKIQIFNGQQSNASITNQGRASSRQCQCEISNDTLMANHQSRNIKVQEKKPVEEAKTPDAWTVESLKSRINVMKIKNTLDEPGMKKAEDVSLTRNGGEVKPKISQVALRSFHKEAGFKNPTGLPTQNNTTKLRLGYRRPSTRNFSTFRSITSPRPVTKALGGRRTISNTPSNKNKKRNWVSRLKRCFVLKKVKGSKCENWKEAPREIPYESEVMKITSPAPILWKPSDMDGNFETHKQSKPAEVVLREKVNPAVLNAEHRVLASISRLISTKKSAAPDVQIPDIEKKIRRANSRVNMMPWLKRSKSTGTVQRLPKLKGFGNLEKDEPRESGYQWILKNRDMVEELKRQSRYAAGKPLVPTEVKNSINQYKLPLKAEISRYRKKLDHKCTEQFCLCSTPKRWYSTCCAGRSRRILSCSDFILVNTRGIKTTESPKEINTPSNFLYRRTQSDNVIGPNSRGYNQGVSYGHRNVDKNNENPVKETRPKKWAWRIPNKTRVFTPQPATLTSPNRIMGTRMSEMSPCALKKQVEELKSLIKKAREEVNEKIDDFSNDPQSGSNYEARLKRLVKAAHNNALKMPIMQPKYTSENNMMDSARSGKKNSPQAMTQYDTKRTETPKPKPEVSVLKSLFKKTKGESNTLANEILSRNNLTTLPALASKRKPEKHASRVYLKLKSLVEAVRKKSAMLDPSDLKLLPSRSLKGSLSVDAVLPVSESVAKKNEKPSDSKIENANKSTSPETVELLAHRTPAPSNTIQLWKGDAKPKEFNYANDSEPTYGDILNLFTRAKGLFYYQPPQNDITTDVQLGNKNLMTENEITKQWLSIREDVSNAARAVAEQNNDSTQVTGTSSQASPQMFSPQHKDVGNASEYMMSNTRMIPCEFLKSEPKITRENMWASVPVKVLEDEDLCRKTNLETNGKDENLSIGLPSVENTGLQSTTAEPKPKLVQPENEIEPQESRRPVSIEPTKLLFQKPIMALGSLTKNFGSVGSFFGKAPESPKHAEPDSAVVNSDTTSSERTLKTEGFSSPLVEGPNTNHQETSFHDAGTQSHITSNSSHVTGYTPEVVPHQNRYVQECIESIKPLEEKVKTYENSYRNYFTEDILSGYNNLQEVYEGLNKLNYVSQTAFKTGLETGKEDCQLVNAQASNPATQNPLENLEPRLQNGVSHGSTEIRSDCPTKAAESVEDDGSNQFTSTHGSYVSSPFTGVFETGNSGNGQSNVWQEGRLGESQHSIEGHIQTANANSQIKPADVKHSTERFIDSEGKIQQGIRTQESEPVKVGITNNSEKNPEVDLEDTQKQFSSLSSKEEPENFDELLTQDPTLNPEVVKNLKLPVILPEDCPTEKNWYTKYYSSTHQNR